MEKQIKKEIINRIEEYVEEEHNGNYSKAASKLGENRHHFVEILKGKRGSLRGSLDKLFKMLVKMNKYNFMFKINKR